MHDILAFAGVLVVVAHDMLCRGLPAMARGGRTAGAGQRERRQS